MEFCPKCGALLIQKNKSEGCARCNYKTKGKVNLKASEKIKDQQKEVEVTDKNAQAFPIVAEQCKKCNNSKAYFWTIQTRSSDEAETKFFKCTKCEHTWREYR